MKKKLLILGLAGTLLFSGLSVSAAVNECGHPSRDERVGTESRNGIACSNPTHINCTIYDFYKIETITCRYCQKRIKIIETYLYTYHTFTSSN